MEAQGAILVLGVAVVVGFVVLSVLASSKHDTEDRLRAASLRLGAGFHAGGLFELPSLTLTLRDCFGRLTFARGREPYTLLALRVPAYRGGSLEIDPPWQGWFLRPAGRRIGGLSLHSYPEELADWIFAPQRRDEALGTVRRLSRYGRVSVAMRAGSLEVRVGACLMDEASIRGLLRTASELIGYMLTPPGECGIRWVDARPLAGSCPVCATLLAHPVTRCGRCDTPHHEQCWDYLGRCAVYGCEPRRRVA